MLDNAGHEHVEGPKRRRPHRHDDERDQFIRRLRDENADLRRHVEVYEEHLRMLTMQNARLTDELHQTADITRLNPHGL